MTFADHGSTIAAIFIAQIVCCCPINCCSKVVSAIIYGHASVAQASLTDALANYTARYHCDCDRTQYR